MLTRSCLGLQDRRRKIDDTRIALSAWVEQVAEGPEPTMLSSRLHEQGQVVGRGMDCLYVRFSDNQVISLPPALVRVVDNVTDGD
jgi:hypothetical protein